VRREYSREEEVCNVSLDQEIPASYDGNPEKPGNIISFAIRARGTGWSGTGAAITPVLGQKAELHAASVIFGRLFGWLTVAAASLAVQNAEKRRAESGSSPRSIYPICPSSSSF